MANKPTATFFDPETGKAHELRDPTIAALLAWLIPGAGHFYQRRSAKGALFSVCILTTFFYGLFLGEGRVVYAAWKPETRWHYFGQIGVGLPALPALIQAQRVRTGKAPFFASSRFMVPPERRNDALDELHLLNRRLHRYFELGSIYTVIAGLLNMLAIYDAWAGPAFILRKKPGEEDDEGVPAAAGETPASAPT